MICDLAVSGSLSGGWGGWVILDGFLTGALPSVSLERRRQNGPKTGMYIGI